VARGFTWPVRRRVRNAADRGVGFGVGRRTGVCAHTSNVPVGVQRFRSGRAGFRVVRSARRRGECSSYFRRTRPANNLRASVSKGFCSAAGAHRASGVRSLERLVLGFARMLGLGRSCGWNSWPEFSTAVLFFQVLRELSMGRPPDCRFVGSDFRVNAGDRPELCPTCGRRLVRQPLCWKVPQFGGRR